MFSMPGIGELLIVLLIVLLLFGAGKLPKVGRQLGSAIAEFKSGIKTETKKDDSDKTDDAE